MTIHFTLTPDPYTHGALAEVEKIRHQRDLEAIRSNQRISTAEKTVLRVVPCGEVLSVPDLCQRVTALARFARTTNIRIELIDMEHNRQGLLSGFGSSILRDGVALYAGKPDPVVSYRTASLQEVHELRQSVEY